MKFKDDKFNIIVSTFRIFSQTHILLNKQFTLLFIKLYSNTNTY